MIDIIFAVVLGVLFNVWSMYRRVYEKNIGESHAFSIILGVIAIIFYTFVLGHLLPGISPADVIHALVSRLTGS